MWVEMNRVNHTTLHLYYFLCSFLALNEDRWIEHLRHGFSSPCPPLASYHNVIIEVSSLVRLWNVYSYKCSSYVLEATWMHLQFNGIRKSKRTVTPFPSSFPLLVLKRGSLAYSIALTTTKEMSVASIHLSDSCHLRTASTPTEKQHWDVL